MSSFRVPLSPLLLTNNCSKNMVTLVGILMRSVLTAVSCLLLRTLYIRICLLVSSRFHSYTFKFYGTFFCANEQLLFYSWVIIFGSYEILLVLLIVMVSMTVSLWYFHRAHYPDIRRYSVNLVCDNQKNIITTLWKV